jgi:hypothetical protein
MKSQKDADPRKTDRPKAGSQAAHQPPMNAPWPDQKARQDMSESELALEDGKHDKNSDWKKTW